MRKVWIRQDGADESEALKVEITEDSYVSDLLTRAVTLFRFDQDYRANQLELVKCDGLYTSLSNRDPMSMHEEENFVLRPRPRVLPVVSKSPLYSHVPPSKGIQGRKSAEIVADGAIFNRSFERPTPCTAAHSKNNIGSNVSMGYSHFAKKAGESSTFTAPSKNTVRRSATHVPTTIPVARHVGKCKVSVTNNIDNNENKTSRSPENDTRVRSMSTEDKSRKPPGRVSGGKPQGQHSSTVLVRDVPAGVGTRNEYITDLMDSTKERNKGASGSDALQVEQTKPQMKGTKQRLSNLWRDIDTKATSLESLKVGSQNSANACKCFVPRWGLPTACRRCGQSKVSHTSMGSYYANISSKLCSIGVPLLKSVENNIQVVTHDDVGDRSNPETSTNGRVVTSSLARAGSVDPNVRPREVTPAPSLHRSSLENFEINPVNHLFSTSVNVDENQCPSAVYHSLSPFSWNERVVTPAPKIGLEFSPYHLDSTDKKLIHEFCGEEHGVLGVKKGVLFEPNISEENTNDIDDEKITSQQEDQFDDSNIEETNSLVISESSTTQGVSKRRRRRKNHRR